MTDARRNVLALVTPARLQARPSWRTRIFSLGARVRKLYRRTRINSKRNALMMDSPLMTDCPPASHASKNSSNLNDARVDELLNLGHDGRVSLMLGGSLGIRGHVLQHLSHHRVGEDALNLQFDIALLTLFQLFLAELTRGASVNLLVAATHAILELFVARIVLQALRVRLQSLVILLGEELRPLRCGSPSRTWGRCRCTFPHPSTPR